DERYAATPAYDEWLELPPAERWYRPPYGGRMGGDGVPRLRLVVVAIDGADRVRSISARSRAATGGSCRPRTARSLPSTTPERSSARQR
ncbi:hypothetical protein ACWCQU_46910, partial [Streptomyces sp. NPDC001975]